LYTRTAVEMEFDHAQQLVAAGQAGSSEVEALYGNIRRELASWCAEPTSDAERSERLGMSAAIEKRIGNLKEGKQAGAGRAEYERAREFYRQARDTNPVNHWVITQYLSMLAILAESKDYAALARDFGNDWVAARQIATWELRAASGEKEAWALGTLAELELLGSVFAGSDFDPQRSKAEIGRLCVRICEAVKDDAFPVFSTRRQFGRYLEHWRREIWTDLAEAALELLPDEGSWVGRPYVPPVQA
jgi:hypothetical protein